MEKTIVIETSAKADLLKALTTLGVTPSKTEDKNGTTEITVDLTNAQEASLQQQFGGDGTSADMVIRESVGRVVEVVTDIADTGVTGILVPILGIGIKTVAGGARIGIKATAQAGASIINNTVDEGAKAVADIKTNAECQKLKQSWATVKSGVASLFAKKPKIAIK